MSPTSPSPFLSRIVFFIIVLASAIVLTGCANKDKDKPWKRSEPKWYESDMSSDERSFFLGGFFGGGGR